MITTPQTALAVMTALIAATLTVGPSQAANAPSAPDHPVVVVDGQSYTPLSILTRNLGSTADQAEQFPPYRVIGNIYYVGTRSLSSFLIVTKAGNILLDTTYERNVPTIAKSVAQLGYKFSDIKIILGNHAHADHMEGNPLAKQMTGAQMVAMAEDVPALTAIKPGGKEQPIDRVIYDGDTVSLGDTTLTAHLTAGHTHGCTAWTMTAEDGGKSYNVVFGCSLRAPAVIPPAIEAEFDRTFKVFRALPCDVLLGDHPAQFNMAEKYAKLKPGGANPFIDKATCTKEADIEEAMFRAILQEQAARKQ